MEERYRLQYFRSKTSLSIKWCNNEDNYVRGDCRVRAIKESTDIKVHNKKNLQSNLYTGLMTKKELKEFISRDPDLLGSMINNCRGLVLEDFVFFEKVDFDSPIEIKNN